MCDTKNDDRLRILQERLAQIKQKEENPNPKRSQDKEVVESSSSIHKTEKIIEKKDPSWGLEEKKPRSYSWLRNIILLSIIVYGLFYIYNSMNDIPPNTTTTTEEQNVFILEYNFDTEESQFKGNQLAIINSFEDESSAKEMVNDLSKKGFKCDYFFLPNKSNSTEKIYKVFIGPYESLEETNQWKENINGEIEILDL